MNSKRVALLISSPNSFPWILLAVFLLTFGILVPWLGFYQDDWHFIFYAYTRGLGKLWELSAYDNRPFASWPYIAGFALLGFRPIAWQIVGLVIRWLTTIVFWMLYRLLWPRHERLAAAAALLFAVYPLYTLQPMAVTYITHWVCYLLFGLSMVLMVRAVQNPRKLWPLLVISLLIDGIQLFTIEYFNGLELLRPLILWLALSRLSGSRKGSLRKTLTYWAPYFLVLASFIIWRGFIFKSPVRDTNSPIVLHNLFSAPLPTLNYLVSAALKDSILIQIDSWGNALQPSLVDLSLVGVLFLAVATASMLGIAFYLKSLKPGAEEDQPDRATITEALAIGLLGLLLGPIPAWITNQPLYDSNPLWNSRLGMAAMFGAALFLAAAIEWTLRTRNQRLIAYGLLIGLSVNYLLHSSNDYRHAWAAEVSFLSQLTWRAPAIHPGTPVTSEGEMLSLMGDYPTAFAMNMMYQQESGSDNTVLWYFPTDGSDHIAAAISSGQTLSNVKFTARFAGNGADTLALWFRPDLSSCLHVFAADDSQSHLYDDVQRQLSLVSNTGRIGTTPSLNDSFIQQALGSDHSGWCYYYQSAELAAQNGQWTDVLKIWKAAHADKLKVSYGPELFPFIQADLQTQQWKDAQNLTTSANQITSTEAMRQSSCGLWADNVGGNASAQAQSAKADVFKSLQCPP